MTFYIDSLKKTNSRGEKSIEIKYAGCIKWSPNGSKKIKDISAPFVEIASRLQISDSNAWSNKKYFLVSMSGWRKDVVIVLQKRDGGGKSRHRNSQSLEINWLKLPEDDFAKLVQSIKLFNENTPTEI